MIWQSRKWRLISRIAAMVVASILMFAMAGPVSYALQDDTPELITISRQLYDKNGAPLADRFIYVEALPDLERIVTTGEGSNTRFLIPLVGYDTLVIYTDKPRYLFPFDYTPGGGFLASPTPIRYMGKVTTLQSQVNAEEAFDGLTAQGSAVDKELVMALVQGEEPSTYRPIVPVMPALAVFWGIAFIGAWQVWRGRRPRRRPPYMV